MSKEEETKDNVVELNDKKDAEKTPKKKSNTRAKKLSNINLDSELNKVRDIQRVNLDVNGTKYFYQIDGQTTTTKEADFINNIKAIIAYSATEKAFDTVTDEEMQSFMASMIIAEVMNIYSDLEVGDTIDEKVKFIVNVTDLGILEDIVTNVPDGILKSIERAEKEIAKLTDQLKSQAEDIKKDIVNLEEKIKEEADNE